VMEGIVKMNDNGKRAQLMSELGKGIGSVNEWGRGERGGCKL